MLGGSVRGCDGAGAVLGLLITLLNSAGEGSSQAVDQRRAGRENFSPPSCAGLPPRCGGRTVLGRGLRIPPAGGALGAEPRTCQRQQVLCDRCRRASLPPVFDALAVSGSKQGQGLYRRAGTEHGLAQGPLLLRCTGCFQR